MEPTKNPVATHPSFHQEVTYWKNPTSQKVTVRLFVGTDQAPHTRKYGRGERLNAHLTVSWQPGETVGVPTQFDSAIHDVRGSQLVGGEAPQLIRVDESGERIQNYASMASALDVPGQAHRAAVEEAKAILAGQATAAESLIIAAAKATTSKAEVEANEARARGEHPQTTPAETPNAKAKAAETKHEPEEKPEHDAKDTAVDGGPSYPPTPPNRRGR